MNEIIKAWTIEGSNPKYHHYQQERLRKEWPALYQAIISNINWDAEWDNIEVPVLKKITDDFTQPKQTLPPLPMVEKITRVLIVVVVAILTILIIKNI